MLQVMTAQIAVLHDVAHITAAVARVAIQHLE